MPLLKKTLDLKPQHIVADIGSGTGFIAENLFTSFVLNSPVWCVDPNAEMQEIARKRKGVYPIQKTAEEFFADPKISQRFDRVIAVWSAHHFVERDAVFKGIVRSLRPGGSFVQVHNLENVCSMFKIAANTLDTYAKAVSECEQLLRGFSLQGKISQEECTYKPSVTKSKLYEIFRGRYMSTLSQLSDEQIEEQITELEDGTFKDVKDDDCISYNYVVRLTKFELE